MPKKVSLILDKMHRYFILNLIELTIESKSDSIWSIFTFILSFRKNKYKIQSYTTFNMDDFKAIYINENLHVVAYFLINERFYLVSLGNPTFSNMFPRARHACVSFRCIFLIYSCRPSKHPSLCELFWYPSPDDGYWNRNFSVNFTS